VVDRVDRLRLPYQRFVYGIYQITAPASVEITFGHIPCPVSSLATTTWRESSPHGFARLGGSWAPGTCGVVSGGFVNI
jgi:hypothetical protein